MSILKCPYLLQTVESMPRAKLKTGAARVFPAFSNENNASCALQSAHMKGGYSCCIQTAAACSDSNMQWTDHVRSHPHTNAQRKTDPKRISPP
jgi:hypothetical protein